MSLVEASISPWHRSVDDRSLFKRAEDALKAHPTGISCKDLAVMLGDAQYTVSAVISKMRSYGSHVKLKREFGKSTWWWE